MSSSNGNDSGCFIVASNQVRLSLLCVVLSSSVDARPLMARKVANLLERQKLLFPIANGCSVAVLPNASFPNVELFTAVLLANSL